MTRDAPTDDPARDGKKRRVEKSPGAGTFHRIPPEVWSQIFPMVGARDLGAMSSTARVFRQLIDLPACLMKRKQWKSLMAFYPKYDPFHRHLIKLFHENFNEFAELIKIAFERERHEFVRHLLLYHGHEFDPSYNRNEMLRNAAKSGWLDVVNLLLMNARVDPSATRDEYGHHESPLHDAAFFGHLDVVNRLLQDPRVDPRADDYEAVRGAMIHENYPGLTQDSRHDRWMPILERFLADPRVDASSNDNQLVVDALLFWSGRPTLNPSIYQC